MIYYWIKKEALAAVKQMDELKIDHDLKNELENDLFLIYTAEHAAIDSVKQKILGTIKTKVTQLRKEAN